MQPLPQREADPDRVGDDRVANAVGNRESPVRYSGQGEPPSAGREPSAIVAKDFVVTRRILCFVQWLPPHQKKKTCDAF